MFKVPGARCFGKLREANVTEAHKAAREKAADEDEEGSIT